MDKHPDTIALRYLRYLVLRDGGYTRRGVPGWALRADVERATGLRLPERLAHLHGRGLLDREDVRAPRLNRPVWIYRVNQAGSDHAARQSDLPWRPILRPLCLAERDSDAAIHIPAGAAVALRELRRAMDEGVESPHLRGERGWQTLQDLGTRLAGSDPAETDRVEGTWERAREEEEARARSAREEADSGTGEPAERSGREAGAERWASPEGEAPLSPPECAPWRDDLAWLERTGLAQKWIVYPGRRAVPLYRITALGGVAIPLEWHDPR